MSRRSNGGVALTLGIFVLALGVLSAVSRAHAFGVIYNEEEKAKCLAEGGNAVERGRPGHEAVLCETPEKDAACVAEFGKGYDYDFVAGECSNLPHEFE